MKSLIAIQSTRFREYSDYTSLVILTVGAILRKNNCRNKRLAMAFGSAHETEKIVR